MTAAEQHPVGARTVRRGRAALVALLATGAAAGVGVVGSAIGADAQTQGGGFPVASGALTSRSGNTLSLDGNNGTTKVIVTSRTTYQQVQTSDASAVTKGSCVRINGSGDASSGITATSVAVVDASQCKQSAQPRSGQNGNFPGGQEGGPPNGAFPEGAGPEGGAPPNGYFPEGPGPESGAPPTGANGAGNGGPQGGFGGGGITGKVTAVDGTTVKVKGRVVTASTNAESQPKVSTKTVTVTLGESTTYSATVDAAADSLTTGVCVNARGTTDSVGTVTATTVTVSQPVNGSCNAGFGPGGAGGAAGTPPTTGANGATTA